MYSRKVMSYMESCDHTSKNLLKHLGMVFQVRKYGQCILAILIVTIYYSLFRLRLLTIQSIFNQDQKCRELIGGW